MALSDCPPTIKIVKLGNPDAERDAINAAFQAILRCWPSGGGGSVTSVDADGGSTGLTFMGGPVTTTGVLTLGGTLGVGSGGTGATTASTARTNLGLGTMAVVNDAPADGSTYGRNNNAWVVAGGGGSSVQSPGCVFSNGNLLLTGILTSEIQLPYGGTIEAWTIAGDAAGDASIIVSHATYAAYPTMTTLFTATCTGSAKAQATGLSHAVAAGDILRFSGSGFALFTRVSITLEVN